MNYFVKTLASVRKLINTKHSGLFAIGCLDVYSWYTSHQPNFKVTFNFAKDTLCLSEHMLSKILKALGELGLMVYTRGGIKRGSGWSLAAVETPKVETPKPAPSVDLRRECVSHTPKRYKINNNIPVIKNPPTPKPEPAPKPEPKPKNPNAGVIENAFQRLWEQFPKKSEEDKNKARWSFWQQTKGLGAKEVDQFLTKLLENVDFRLKNDHLWRETRFIPNIRNFLYDRAWLRPVVPKPKEKLPEPTVVAQLSDRSWAESLPRIVETSDWVHPELSRTRDLTIDQQVLDCSWADQPSCLAELSRG